MVIPDDGVVVSDYCFSNFVVKGSAVYFTVHRIDDVPIADEDTEGINEIISCFGLWEDHINLERIQKLEAEGENYQPFDSIHEQYNFDLFPEYELIRRSGKRFGLVLNRRYYASGELDLHDENLRKTVINHFINVKKYRALKHLHGV